MTTIKSDKLTVRIKSNGAEISSIKNDDGIEFIWQANPEIWPRHAPVLFPIVGKLKNNKYNFQGEDFELGQHGFARDLEFKLISKEHSSCSFAIYSNEETFKNFPFDFDFIIAYSIEGNKLTTEYKIKNTGGSSLRFAVGAHPGFNCPIQPSEKFEDYYIELDKSDLEITELDNGLRGAAKKALHLEEKKLLLNANTFDKDALVFENQQVNTATLRSTKSEHYVQMECRGWPYFGIWSKKGCKEFVCLEPWFGIADSTESTGNFEEKDGLIVLQPDEKFNCSFSVAFN